MNIHLIEHGYINVAYFANSMRYFEINTATKALINDYLNRDLSDQDVADIHGLSMTDYKAFINTLQEYDHPVSIRTIELEDNKLNRLVMNISNRCNLKCKYCYANGGSYCSEEDYMSVETAKIAIDEIYKKYKIINNLQLFGGEPTLNMKVASFILKYVTEKYEAGLITKLPAFSMVTNGIILTDEFIRLVKQYKLKITVSFDGDPKVNDEMRIFEDSTGTSKVIMRNIKRLKLLTGQPEVIEATYNKKHVEHNVSIADIINFIHNELGDINLHIVPVSGDENFPYTLSDYSPFVDSVDDLFIAIQNKKAMTYTVFSRLINNLNNKSPNQYLCDAGFGTLSVSTKGDIYPCFMFTDNKKYQMGTIDSFMTADKDLFAAVQDRFYDFNKYRLPSCENCFAKSLCFGCLGINEIENEDIEKAHVNNCEMYKEMIERIIIDIVKAKNNVEIKLSAA